MIIDKIVPAHCNGRTKVYVAFNRYYEVFDVIEETACKYDIQKAVDYARDSECFYYDKPLSLVRSTNERAYVFKSMRHPNAYHIRIEGRKLIYCVYMRDKIVWDEGVNTTRSLQPNVTTPLPYRYMSKPLKPLF